MSLSFRKERQSVIRKRVTQKAQLKLVRKSAAKLLSAKQRRPVHGKGLRDGFLKGDIRDDFGEETNGGDVWALIIQAEGTAVETKVNGPRWPTGGTGVVEEMRAEEAGDTGAWSQAA